MAQKTIVELIDDLDGTSAEETIYFAIDGIEYSIDLSGDNAKTLRDGLAVFVDNAQRVGGRRGRPSLNKTRPGATGKNREQNQAIREWARSQGLKISDRGRVSEEIQKKFDDAH